jgi:hypothetical protein
LQVGYQQAAAEAEAAPAGALLLPGTALRADPELLARVEALLGLRSAEDDGADLAVALEIGADIDPARKRRFLAAVEGRSLVVGDGLLLRELRRCLPQARLQGLGEALGNLASHSSPYRQRRLLCDRSARLPCRPCAPRYPLRRSAQGDAAVP